MNYTLEVDYNKNEYGERKGCLCPKSEYGQAMAWVRFIVLFAAPISIILHSYTKMYLVIKRTQGIAKTTDRQRSDKLT